jgi:hypothetical protein
MLENRILRRIFKLNKEDITGDWRKYHHNEEFHKLYFFFPNIVQVMKPRKMIQAGHRHIACMGEMRNAYKILATKFERKRAPGKHTYR